MKIWCGLLPRRTLQRRLCPTPAFANILFALNLLSSLGFTAGINPNGRLGFLVGDQTQCSALTLGGREELTIICLILNTHVEYSCNKYQVNLKKSNQDG
jgi:hypothetical protein